MQAPWRDAIVQVTIRLWA